MEVVFSILSSPFLFSSHNSITVQETYLVKINMRGGEHNPAGTDEQKALEYYLQDISH
jgi:hypothetical protein